jgi:hypothetical protein
MQPVNEVLKTFAFFVINIHLLLCHLVHAYYLYVCR